MNPEVTVCGECVTRVCVCVWPSGGLTVDICGSVAPKSELWQNPCEVKMYLLGGGGGGKN
jgi:hypothetical protein